MGARKLLREVQGDRRLLLAELRDARRRIADLESSE
jgi:hypothetical protein